MIVDLFGLSKLTNSFGVSMMFYGSACLISLPIGAMFYNLTDGYVLTYCFAGGSITLAGLLLIPVRRVLRHEIEKELKLKAERERRKQSKRAPNIASKPGPSSLRKK